MDDAALVAVELGRSRDAAVGHAYQFPVPVDRVGDALAAVFRKEEVAAVAERFGGIATGHEHGRAQHLCITGEAKLDGNARGIHGGDQQAAGIDELLQMLDAAETHAAAHVVGRVRGA